MGLHQFFLTVYECGYVSQTHPFRTSPYIWQTAHHRTLRSVCPACGCCAPRPQGGRWHTMRKVLVTLLHSYVLQTLLKEFLPYTEITRHTWGAQEHLWWVGGCRTGGSSAEGHSSGGTGPVCPRNPKAVGISASHSVTMGVLTIKASIKTPVLGGGKTECRKAQTFLYVTSTCHKAFCYHGNEHGINT